MSYGTQSPPFRRARPLRKRRGARAPPRCREGGRAAVRMAEPTQHAAERAAARARPVDLVRVRVRVQG